MTEAEALHRAWNVYAFGFVALGLTTIQLWFGTSLDKGPHLIIRAEKPVLYWSNVIVTGIGSVVFLATACSRFGASKYATAAEVLAIASLAGAAVLARTAMPQYKRERAEFLKPTEFSPTADLNTDVSVVVRGWTKPELDRILTDFLRTCRLRGLSVHVNKVREEVLVISFVPTIDSDKLMYLVNYIQYPKHFDLKKRMIAVAGRVRLSAAMGPSDPALAGRMATIYVPAGDTDYDRVYAKVESNGVYEISFANMEWIPARTDRMPPAIEDLRLA